MGKCLKFNASLIDIFFYKIEQQVWIQNWGYVNK